MASKGKCSSNPKKLRRKQKKSPKPPDLLENIETGTIDPELSAVADRSYETRKIYFMDRAVNIVCQDVNGPCSLLAICNALSLKGIMKIGLGKISEAQLIAILVSTLKVFPTDGMEAAIGFSQPQLIEVVHRMGRDLALNVNFSGTQSFGDPQKLYGGCAESALFAFLFVKLCHGWVIDPQDEDLLNYVNGEPYEELEFKLQTYNSLVTQGSELNANIIEKYTQVGNLLNGNSLTAYGLSRLHDDFEEEEVFVLFWRKHFYTGLKYNGHLYLLQNDLGYIHSDIVWKHLDGINDEGAYLTCFFTTSGRMISECCFDPLIFYNKLYSGRSSTLILQLGSSFKIT